MYTGHLLKKWKPQVKQMHSHWWRLCQVEERKVKNKKKSDIQPKLMADNTAESASLLNDNMQLLFEQF